MQASAFLAGPYDLDMNPMTDRMHAARSASLSADDLQKLDDRPNSFSGSALNMIPSTIPRRHAARRSRSDTVAHDCMSVLSGNDTPRSPIKNAVLSYIDGSSFGIHSPPALFSTLKVAPGS